jgi:hypothetical protein
MTKLASWNDTPTKQTILDFVAAVTDKSGPRYVPPNERVAVFDTVAYRYVGSDDDEIVQQAELDVIDDGPGKPVQIWNVIGRRPILAAGNSNGDLPMMAFAGGSSLPALRLLVVHDDADREFDYVAGAEKAISVAQIRGWTTVSIQSDWNQVFPSLG